MANTPDSLTEEMESPHKHGGNPGYHALPMLSAYVMQFALGERYANAFLNRLDSDARLLRICGLDQAPSEGAYSRFKKKLAHHLDAVETIMAGLFIQCGDEIERLREAGQVQADKPPLGHSLVMDSTDVEAWARPGWRSRKTGEQIPSKDGDARWGHRTAKTARSMRSGASKRRSVRKSDANGVGSEDGKDQLYFGYKVNVITDANYGLPLFSATRPANASDVTVLIQDTDDCLALYRTLSLRYLVCDKGYDSLKNIQHLVSLGIMPVVAIRRPEQDQETGRRLYDGIYEADGRPTCVGGKAMEYIVTDANLGHLFQCPPEGCHLKDRMSFSLFCDSRHYEKPEGRLLRIVGLLPRCSDEWQAEYWKRGIIERGFSSCKHSRLLNQHRYFNIQMVSLHVAMSILSYLATALAHLRADDYTHMRHMRVRLPSAKPTRTKRRAEERVDPGIVAALMMHELNAMPQAA